MDEGRAPRMKQDAVVTSALISLYWVLWHASTVFEYAPHASLWYVPSGLVVAILPLWKRSGFFKAWISVFTLSVFAQLTLYASLDIGHSVLISAAMETRATLPYRFALETF